MRRTAILIGSVVVVLILGGALIVSAFRGNDVRIGYAENSHGNTLHSRFYYFNGTDSKKVSFSKGDEVKVVYSINLKKGALQLKLKDQAGQDVLSKSEGSGEVTFTVDRTQNYRIEVIATKAKGSYKLDWSKSS